MYYVPKKMDEPRQWKIYKKSFVVNATSWCIKRLVVCSVCLASRQSNISGWNMEQLKMYFLFSRFPAVHAMKQSIFDVVYSIPNIVSIYPTRNFDIDTQHSHKMKEDLLSKPLLVNLFMSQWNNSDLPRSMSVEALPRAMRPSIQPSQQGLVMNLASPRSAPARVYSPQIAKF